MFIITRQYHIAFTMYYNTVRLTYYKDEVKMYQILLILLMSLSILQNSSSAEAASPKKYVYVGDSRFVGMENAKCGKKDVYIAKRNMGYDWFVSQESNFRQHDSKSTVYVIGFGVNDLAHAERYADYVNNLNLDGKVYFCQVNPINEPHADMYGYTVRNVQVDRFNLIVKKKAKNYKILKTNKYLVQRGYTTIDGLHYDRDTYRVIYNYIRRNVRGDKKNANSSKTVKGQR